MNFPLRDGAVRQTVRDLFRPLCRWDIRIVHVSVLLNRTVAGGDGAFRQPLRCGGHLQSQRDLISRDGSIMRRSHGFFAQEV